MGSSTPSVSLRWDLAGRCYEFSGVINWRDPMSTGTIWHFDPRADRPYIKRRPSLDVPSRPDLTGRSTPTVITATRYAEEILDRAYGPTWREHDMGQHTHDFRTFIGLPTSFGRTAWVREDYVAVSQHVGEDAYPRKMACDTCGEQGYKVPADAPVL